MHGDTEIIRTSFCQQLRPVSCMTLVNALNPGILGILTSFAASARAAVTLKCRFSVLLHTTTCLMIRYQLPWFSQLLWLQTGNEN